MVLENDGILRSHAINDTKSKNIIMRELMAMVQARFFKGQAIALIGPRRSGKTTLIHTLMEHCGKPHLLLNADQPDVRDLLEHPTHGRLRAFFGRNRMLCIQGAQRVANIGAVLKLIVDRIPEVQVIVTGSCVLDMSVDGDRTQSVPNVQFTLYPFSFAELATYHGLGEERRWLEQRLIYGSYPWVVLRPHLAKELISMLVESYLFKDLLLLDGLKKPSLLEKLVKALALKIGSEISFYELGQLTGADAHTVERYVDLLERAFVLFRLPAYSRSVRNEIKKGKKIYFVDNGVRNAMIGNFLPLTSRTDSGPLWENFLVAERRKLVANRGLRATGYFWRTTQKQQIDYVEADGPALTAYAFKQDGFRSTAAFAKTFTGAYRHARTEVVFPRNYDQFLSLPKSDGP